MNNHLIKILSPFKTVERNEPDLTVTLFTTSIILWVSSFSPYLGFFAIILFLAFFGNGLSGLLRKILGLILIFTGSIIISSREVVPYSSDDMHRYFQVYEQIYAGNSFIQYFKPEFLISAYYRFLTFIPVNLSINGLMFFTSLLISGLYWLWLELYGTSYLPKRMHSILISSSFLFFSFYSTTQLSRQMLGLVILLFALNSNGKKRFILIILMTISHFTCLPIYFITKGLLRRTNLSFLTIFCSTIIFSFSFPALITLYSKGLLDWVPEIHKLSYYSSPENLRGFNPTDLAELPKLSILFVIFFLSKPLNLTKEWGAVFSGFLFIFLALLPYTLLPTRISLMIISVLPGFLLTYATRSTRIINLSIISMIVCWRIYTLGSRSGYLWHKFPAFSIDPFYYFAPLFTYLKLF
ncbi:MAG: hypothetical protein NDI69_15300 [Bacteriovoracaceae bacterium]|nr:hypothetical protein [Bacteriovoracaceae bacterium]